MIDELGGDDPWERMRDVYYNVYNKNLGRRKRYFTFVADGNLNEGNTDLLNGPKGRPIRYTDKGMTKEVVPHARYALKLDVTRTFTQQVKRQEHFIAWAEWVRDMNYLLSSRGFYWCDDRGQSRAKDPHPGAGLYKRHRVTSGHS